MKVEYFFWKFEEKRLKMVVSRWTEKKIVKKILFDVLKNKTSNFYMFSAWNFAKRIVSVDIIARGVDPKIYLNDFSRNFSRCRNSRPNF